MADLRLRLSRIEKNVEQLARNHVQWEQADREFVRFLSEDPKADDLARQLEERIADYSGQAPPSDYAPTESEEERLWLWAVQHDEAALQLCGKLLSRWSEYAGLRAEVRTSGSAAGTR